MQKIVTCSQMKALDSHTITEMGVPSLVLMERAALSVVEEIRKEGRDPGKILAVCGTGNNGGDGIAIARILHLQGEAVSIYIPENPSKMSEETRTQMKIADNYGVPVVNNPRWSEYTTIVDAIFGIGLTREVQGRYSDVIEEINRQSAVVWAVDIPSGINGDTGAVMGHAVQADRTVTFAYGKTGLYLYPGASFCGKVLVKDIGIYADENTDSGCLSAMDIRDLRAGLPKRSPEGNKGTFGKVLIAAGSRNMAGAAYLCARSALAAGAGMVKIHTVEENRVILQQLLPEALLYTDEECGDTQTNTDDWQRNLDWCDVLVAGPGLGTNSRSSRILEFYLAGAGERTVILDADALNLVSADRKLLKYCGEHTVLTPHIGEMSRLTGRPIEKIKENALSTARDFAMQNHVSCVLKDARTITVMPDGQAFLNISGNSGMATAGSGDVLAGILGGLAAQRTDVAMLPPLGVYLHGVSGDAAAASLGKRSMTASDIITGLRGTLKNVEEEL